MRGNDLDLGQITGSKQRCGLDAAARGTHLHVVGATGVGKSKFLEHLIRQDIRNHGRSGCGLLMIDRHGPVYDGIMRWLARYDPEAELPVVPIDLRREDVIVAYNPLRARSAAPPVVAANVVDSIAHVWGAGAVTETPRFAHIGRLVVRTLYAHGLTLAEAPALLTPKPSPLRDALGERSTGLDHDKWDYVRDLKPTERLTSLESSINRFDPFAQTPLLCTMLGQPGRSLDLGRVLARGYIVLVAAASERAKISDDDARVFATLLLSDLWTAAKERGKRDSVRPFYLYLDEFQEFVTPTIAKSLDQARGFGLHLTLAHQFPKQLKNAGPHGEQLYDSVMENARNKVAFHLAYDLEEMTRSLFQGTLNPDEVKHQLWSTKVVGQHAEMRVSRNRNVTTGLNAGRGTTVDKRRPDDTSEPEETGKVTEAANEIEIDTLTEGETESSVMVQDFGRELASVQFRSIEEQMARARKVLFDQQQRQCMVRPADARLPIALRTPDVTFRPASHREVEQYLKRRLRRWRFALTADEARRALIEKDAEIATRFFRDVADEPLTAGRRLR
jgi:hypothetical protein